MYPISHKQAARELCRLSGWTLSNLKLQKLLYIAELYCVGESNGTDQLIASRFEAWDYGPVVPDSYHMLKIFGSRPVANIFRRVPEIEDAEKKELLARVHRVYGSLPAGQLVHITHWEEGAWAKRYAPGANVEITRQDILEEYRSRRNRLATA